MSTKLGIYNLALHACGESALSALTEDREPRRLCDLQWDNGLVSACLEEGLWNFAVRADKVDYSPSVTPTWGYRYAFDKKSDYVRTVAVAHDEYFRVPCTDYSDEAGFWFASVPTIYVKYVSNDTSGYGGDLGKWPNSFQDFIVLDLASRIALKLTQDQKKADEILAARNKQLIEARGRDAMNEPTKFPPMGSWRLSRLGRRSSRDRGNTGQLIG